MKTKKTSVKKNNSKKKVSNSADIKNGLSEALMGFTPGGMGGQLDQADTIFGNNRWYLISNMRQVLSEIYAEHGLIQTVVDVPVDDGLRGGVDVKTKQLSEVQVQDLLAALDRQDDVNTVGQAMKWNRLYGGAGVVIMTDQDPETPLNVSTIGQDTPLEFRAVDMWELFWDKQNTEAYDPSLQEHKFEHFSYYGTKLHKSRVMRLKGVTPPSFIRPRLRGWGLSVVEPLVRSINQYFKTNNLCFEVLDEFKLDIYKIKNLTTTLLSPSGTASVQQRIQLANQQKNYQNAITMDAEDDYVQKQLSFSGIAEILAQIRIQIAGDLRMPITKIFGISATGFNSGEDDIENYNAMIESQIRSKCKYDILRIVEIRCQKMFGFIPTDLQISFKPLRILSAEQEENVKTQKFNRVMQSRTSGEIDSLEFRDALNRDNLLGIQLEKVDIFQAQSPDVAADGSTEEPEHNKTYSRSPMLNEADEEDEENETLVLNPGDVDEALWAKAKRASEKAFGKIKYPFVTWWYKEHGGTFNEKAEKKQNYFTEADHVKIEFEPGYHPRDEKGVFVPQGEGKKKVETEADKEKYALDKVTGSEYLVLWSFDAKDETKKCIMVKKIDKKFKRRIKEEFKNTKYHTESFDDKPSIEEGKTYPLDAKFK